MTFSQSFLSSYSNFLILDIFCLAILGYVVCNEEENILTWERFLHPQICFGVPMERMLGGKGSSDKVWIANN
jgi:hypothetical protein